MPSPVDRLLDAFRSGSLVRPDHGKPCLVDLVRAIAVACGVDLPMSEVTSAVRRTIGTPEHLIFILLDGLGINLIEKLPAESFLRRHLREPILATCPST